MKSRVISITTILIMLVSVLGITTVYGIDNNEEIRGDFIYSKGTNKIVAYAGEGGVCEVPADTILGGLYNVNVPHGKITKLIINKGVDFHSLNGLEDVQEIDFKDGVTEIPNNVMSDCDDLEKVVFPSSLRKVGNNAFSNCPKIETLDFPEGLEYIGEGAFKYTTALSGDITIPDTVTFIGYEAFAYCGDLNKVHLSDNVSFEHKKPEGYNSWDYTTRWFAKSHIKEINIPDSMLDNPVGMFYADEISFNSDMTVNIYKAVEGSPWCEEKYIKGKTNKSTGGYKNFIIVEDTLLRYIGSSKEPVVPEQVTTIEGNAFYFCDIDKVTLPDGMKTMKSYSFNCTTLKEITIPKNVDMIEENAFSMCPFLAKVTFEGAPKNIASHLFDDSYYLNDEHKENVIFKDASIKIPDEDFYANGDEMVLEGFYAAYKDHTGIDLSVDNNHSTHTDAIPETTENIKETTSPIEVSELSDISGTILIKSGSDLRVSIGKRTVLFPDAQPFIDENNRTQIPVRAVAEMLGCTVDWNGEAKTVTITHKNGDTVRLTIDSNIMTVNGKSVQMDTAAIIKDERTYIPVRFVAEAMGLTVEWVQ